MDVAWLHLFYIWKNDLGGEGQGPAMIRTDALELREDKILATSMALVGFVLTAANDGDISEASGKAL